MCALFLQLCCLGEGGSMAASAGVLYICLVIIFLVTSMWCLTARLHFLIFIIHLPIFIYTVHINQMKGRSLGVHLVVTGLELLWLVQWKNYSGKNIILHCLIFNNFLHIKGPVVCGRFKDKYNKPNVEVSLIFRITRLIQVVLLPSREIR